MNQSNSKHLKSSMKKSSCYEEKLMLMSVRKMKSKKVFVDKISELPDDILYFIISSLTLKEAARTGILSKRWRFLWMKCVSSTLSHNLDVLAMDTVPNPRNEIGDCLGGGGKFLESYSSDQLTLLPVESPNFLGFIYQILHLDHCCMKDSMTVRIYLDNNTVENIDQLKDMALAQRNDFAHNIDKWIKMAVAKQIDPSHFFIRRDIYRDGDRYYPFPCLFPAHETKPSLKFMGLRRCSVSSPVSNRLSSLTSIRIKHVVITDEIVTGILSHSHDLEKLTLSRCEGLLHLKIFGPSLKLKHLTILFCLSLTKVEVRAKYLTRLQYCGYSVEFMHMDVPTLCEVIIRNAHHDSRNALNYARENLSSDVPQLESLTLSLSPIEERKMTGQSAPFANLKKLMIQTFPGLFWGFIPLLQMSPYLRNFQLHVHRVDEKKGAVSEKPCNSPYPYLEEITLSGFIGSPHEIEFATYLLKNSPNLKKMTIFYDFLFYVSETNSLDRYGEEDVEKLAAKGPCILNMAEKESGVVEQLNNLQSPGIQILFI